MATNPTPTPPATPKKTKTKAPLCWCKHEGPANQNDHKGTDGMCIYNEKLDQCDCGGFEAA